MASYSADARNAIAATLASLMQRSSVVLLSATNRVLAILTMPTLTSSSAGVLEASGFDRVTAQASGEPVRYEVRLPNGQVLLLGGGADLKMSPSSFVEGGLVYIDSFSLSV